MQYIILYVFLFVLCTFGVKIAPDVETNILNIQNRVNNLRGVFALFIILTHCTLAFDTLPILLIPFRKVSTFGVGYFFVLSGYGLAYSYTNKENYLRDFYKKIMHILWIALISRIVSMILSVILLNERSSVIEIFTGMNWYIYALIVLYGIFYISYKFIPKRNIRFLVICCLTFLMTMVALYFRLGRSYYISEMAFPLGIAIYEYKDSIERGIDKYNSLVFVFMTVILVVLFYLTLKVDDYTFSDFILHNLMLVPFYFFVGITCRYMIFDNLVLRFLKKYSFEIYLYQNIVFSYLKSRLPYINVIYFILSILLTVVLSWVVNNIYIIIVAYFKEKTKNCK